MHTLRSALREFAMSSSGQVEPATGITKGILVASLATGAAVIGTVTQADAEYCYGIPAGQYGWVCKSVCDGAGCGALLYNQRQYHHYWDDETEDCYWTGQTRCYDACC